MTPFSGDNSLRYFCTHYLIGLTLSREEIVGKTDDEIFPKESAELFRVNDRKVLESNRPFEFEEFFPQADGAHTYLSLKFPIQDSSGAPYAICGISNDITERKRMEVALKLKSDQAEEASRTKSEFLSNVSHELRTPLNAILGYAMLLLDGTYGSLVPEQIKVVDSIRRNGDDLLNLVNQLLDLERIESGRLRINLGPVDLGRLFREIYQGIKPLFDQKGLSLDWAVETALPSIESDEQKVKQIFINLLTNAVKFTHEGGVRINASDLPKQRGVEIVVRDTGIGIPPDLLPRIFEPFFQVDSSSTREYCGVGLGLAIVKELLGLLGGTIRVESQAGDGATFIVFLPYRRHPE